MWYFTWILGLSVAVLFAVVNAMWLEVQDDNLWHEQRNGDEPAAAHPRAPDNE